MESRKKLKYLELEMMLVETLKEIELLKQNNETKENK